MIVPGPTPEPIPLLLLQTLRAGDKPQGTLISNFLFLFVLQLTQQNAYKSRGFGKRPTADDASAAGRPGAQGQEAVVASLPGRTLSAAVSGAAVEAAGLWG